MGHMLTLMDTVDGVYRMTEDEQHWLNVLLIPLAALMFLLAWLTRGG